MNKKKFLMQGTVLTIIYFLISSSSMLYRSYLSSNIGTQGLALYQLIFSIFVFAVTLSTSGISLAVTRLVSSAIASGKRSQIRSIVNKCLLFCLCLSLSISCLFLFCSDFCARVFLGDELAANSLKILGIGLPFMSLCTCLKGYFLAVDEATSSGIADLVEQFLTIGTTFFIFTFIPFDTIEQACVGAMVSSTLGEMASFALDFYTFKKSLKKNEKLKKEKSNKVFSSLGKIALPCTLSSAARSALNSAENLLIPKQLQLGGASYSGSMVSYGLLHAMALPILYFPSAFIGSFAGLLIPKICKEYEQNHKKSVAYITSKALKTTLNFGIICCTFFMFHSSLLSEVVYKTSEAATFIAVLAPLAPLMYLDLVVDCLLKGLNQQLNSMKYNIMDSAIRVILILIFMRFYGINSYVYIIFFSIIFNAGLSLHKVIQVTNVKFDFLKTIFTKIPLAIFCLYFSYVLPVESDNKMLLLIIYIAVSFGIYYLISFVLAGLKNGHHKM
ncbi:MAG: oligosaccharide flippase family protein [Clostridia bacterium]